MNAQAPDKATVFSGRLRWRRHTLPWRNVTERELVAGPGLWQSAAQEEPADAASDRGHQTNLDLPNSRAPFAGTPQSSSRSGTPRRDPANHPHRTTLARAQRAQFQAGTLHHRRPRACTPRSSRRRSSSRHPSRRRSGSRPTNWSSRSRSNRQSDLRRRVSPRECLKRDTRQARHEPIRPSSSRILPVAWITPTAVC